VRKNIVKELRYYCDCTDTHGKCFHCKCADEIEELRNDCALQARIIRRHYELIERLETELEAYRA
jgi:hypothetical protein